MSLSREEYQLLTDISAETAVQELRAMSWPVITLDDTREAIAKVIPPCVPLGPNAPTGVGCQDWDRDRDRETQVLAELDAEHVGLWLIWFDSCDAGLNVIDCVIRSELSFSHVSRRPGRRWWSVDDELVRLSSPDADNSVNVRELTRAAVLRHLAKD